MCDVIIVLLLLKIIVLDEQMIALSDITLFSNVFSLGNIVTKRHTVQLAYLCTIYDWKDADKNYITFVVYC